MKKIRAAEEEEKLRTKIWYRKLKRHNLRVIKNHAKYVMELQARKASPKRAAINAALKEKYAFHQKQEITGIWIDEFTHHIPAQMK